MATTLFDKIGVDIGPVGIANAVSLFEIRLDQRFVVLRGRRDEAASASLSGIVFLSLSQSLPMREIYIRYTIQRKIGWISSRAANVHYRSPEILFRNVISLKGQEKLQAGDHELPFRWEVPGNTAESLEGLRSTWVIHHLKATLKRQSTQSKKETNTYVRVIRIPNETDDRLHVPSFISKTWPEKLEAEIQISPRAVLFGSTVKVDFLLTTNLAELKIPAVAITLVQINKCRSEHRVKIVKETRPLDDVVAESDGYECEIYTFSVPLSLPRSLQTCLQDYEHPDLRVRHKLEIKIHLEHPHVPVSTLEAGMPIFIFISPDLPFNQDNAVTATSAEIALVARSTGGTFLPPYENHTWDEIYEGIDAERYLAPREGANAPARRPDLAMTTLQAGSGSSDVLPSRLGDSHDRGEIDHTAASSSQIEDSARNEQGTPGVIQPDTSTQGQEPKQQHGHYDIENMSKVPGYETAAQSASNLSSKRGPPSYDAATQSTTSGNDDGQQTSPRE
ncbi:uncharacterized protein KY384_002663 [Bacidia gigantensis]|uniref:uncharacterized protein n=1 Tax=Bacidia gigantensis TaxID=2732470 RepID=UPI001D0509F9|nr:uncharacterized protein KY384_002663 [Bacidia gigantensis]KAG8532785.1 hypothetical protein KY384_002663 [Bacidia gigantensis]